MIDNNVVFFGCAVLAVGITSAIYVNGCMDREAAPAQPTPNLRVVESVTTPEMIAELHRKEAEFFKKLHEAQEPPKPQPLKLDWEPLSTPAGSGPLSRTRVPGGWLVLYGDVAVIVTDAEHAWANNDQGD